MKPKNKMHPKTVRKLADHRKLKGKRKLRVQRFVRHPAPRESTAAGALKAIDYITRHFNPYEKMDHATD